MSADDLNLPFERQEPTEHTESFAVSGGVVVVAAVFPSPILPPQPVLVFRFAKADGSGFMPPIALFVDRSQVDGLATLVQQAGAAALEAAGQ